VQELPAGRERRAAHLGRGQFVRGYAGIAWVRFARWTKVWLERRRRLVDIQDPWLKSGAVIDVDRLYTNLPD
jgi:hypothetical protein